MEVIKDMFGEIVSAIAGGLAALVIPWLLRIRRKSLDRYNSTWQVTHPQEKATKYGAIESTITLELHGKNELRGRGFSQLFGEYEIKGISSRFCNVLLYYGTKHREGVAGVALVQKAPDESKYCGNWIEIDQDYALMHGTVVMTKIEG